jgi:hypothetical protein
MNDRQERIHDAIQGRAMRYVNGIQAALGLPTTASALRSFIANRVHFMARREMRIRQAERDKKWITCRKSFCFLFVKPSISSARI